MISSINIINLPQSIDRREKMIKQFEQIGISYKICNATYGYDSLFTNLQTNEIFYGIDLKNKLSKRIDGGVKHTITCNPESNTSIKFNYAGVSITAGEAGLWCSNIMVWQEAQVKGYDRTIILEDDIRILNIAHFKQQLEDFISNLPESCDVAYMYLIKYLPNTLLKEISLPNNSYVHKFDSNFEARGTQAVIYSKKAIETLLSYETYSGSIDGFLWNIAINEDYQSPEVSKLTQGLLEICESSKELIGIDNCPSILAEMRT